MPSFCTVQGDAASSGPGCESPRQRDCGLVITPWSEHLPFVVGRHPIDDVSTGHPSSRSQPSMTKSMDKIKKLFDMISVMSYRVDHQPGLPYHGGPEPSGPHVTVGLYGTILMDKPPFSPSPVTSPPSFGRSDTQTWIMRRAVFFKSIGAIVSDSTPKACARSMAQRPSWERYRNGRGASKSPVPRSPNDIGSVSDVIAS